MSTSSTSIYTFNKDNGGYTVEHNVKEPDLKDSPNYLLTKQVWEHYRTIEKYEQDIEFLLKDNIATTSLFSILDSSQEDLINKYNNDIFLNEQVINNHKQNIVKLNLLIDQEIIHIRKKVNNENLVFKYFEVIDNYVNMYTGFYDTSTLTCELYGYIYLNNLAKCQNHVHYEGELLQNKYHGQGCVFYEKSFKSKWKGEWKNGKFTDGSWTVYKNNLEEGLSNISTLD